MDKVIDKAQCYAQEAQADRKDVKLLVLHLEEANRKEDSRRDREIFDDHYRCNRGFSESIHDFERRQKKG